MMAAATADHATEIQQMKFITHLDRRGHIANKTFQRAPSSQHADDQIPWIHFRQPARRQFQHVISSIVCQHPHHNYVTRTRRPIFADYT